MSKAIAKPQYPAFASWVALAILPVMQVLHARGRLTPEQARLLPHCSAPSCNPLRASLLTGILPSSSGV